MVVEYQLIGVQNWQGLTEIFMFFEMKECGANKKLRILHFYYWHYWFLNLFMHLTKSGSNFCQLQTPLCWLAGRSKTAHRICFPLLYFNLNLFFKYEIIVRTRAWSFVIQILIQAVCSVSKTNFALKKFSFRIYLILYTLKCYSTTEVILEKHKLANSMYV